MDMAKVLFAKKNSHDYPSLFFQFDAPFLSAITMTQGEKWRLSPTLSIEAGGQPHLASSGFPVSLVARRHSS